MNLFKMIVLLSLCVTTAYTADKPVTTKKTTGLGSGAAFIGAGAFGLKTITWEERAAKKRAEVLFAEINAGRGQLGFKPLPSLPQPQPRLRLNRVPFWGSTLFGAYLLSKGLLSKYYPNNGIMPTKFRTNKLESKSKSVYNRKHRDAKGRHANLMARF